MPVSEIWPRWSEGLQLSVTLSVFQLKRWAIVVCPSGTNPGAIRNLICVVVARRSHQLNERMSLTSAQQAAVVARGNVLVVAGAGTGKTSALVERCLTCLLSEQPRASLDEILMVTFTEAAAADMRRRIRRRLDKEAEACQFKPGGAEI